MPYKNLFSIHSPFQPTGDQPAAIEYLSNGICNNESQAETHLETHHETHQVLLGVTGSGKTFTMANIIAEVGKPALIIAPNKTLAAQLYNEFKSLFPENAVEYFVSYYDYYQPEAYIPSSDTYIQKDSAINEMIDKMRHSATRSVLARKDVIVVASVSCIYGLGAPEDYLALRVEVAEDMEKSREKLLSELVGIQYERNDIDFHRGTFRVRGDRVEIFPAYEEAKALRIDFFGDTIESLSEIDPLKGDILNSLKATAVYPASHYVTQTETRKRAVQGIIEELKERLEYYHKENRLLEAQRLEERTMYDLEMINEMGYCNGIENYSRHLTGRNPGEPPPTLLDYFPDDFLIFFDESHISVPQIGAMYKADRSRKDTLVLHGFRLPSAIDNRPLKFEEFKNKARQVIYVSATPADYELNKAGDRIAEQIVRPTGLLDPLLEIRGAKTQVDDLYEEIVKKVEMDERVLVTTLTKRMAEDLTDYFSDLSIKVKYLHSDIGTVERIDIIQDLRKGVFDVLIGINLLREGLDIPEVSLVAILDADKEGFLRSFRSLIQTFGRAARNASGKVIMYADRITPSMKKAMEETDRRREIQEAYNQKHGIIPSTIMKDLKAFDYTMEKSVMPFEANSHSELTVAEAVAVYGSDPDGSDHQETLEDIIKGFEIEMKHAAAEMKFEKAAELRDRIKELKKIKEM
ncbi:excinulease of nucleotide excision repair, DNA damage recognition component [Desulfamplus magnetovallimortis]|uniref:UvrABC system protein B n=1 Tax=Desulfamplus magnetovallimortis TaxID=1246637 RepID=A0A1W1HDP7_9BACT|nr:excinuclease ABC subunit UvrB [Desulfamplus magnetovallimortis]SLM30508.1 excinulease of nucleotide excision repair, DNA damage recognition component [Desulfamplus magnetovallimortis]